jgi:hypothetical protein
MKKVDKISRVSIKDAFPLEYKNLTPWLNDNIDVISEAIGIQLVNPQREKSTGSFNVDIWAETTNGEAVVIENQFGSSNHDHLGKIITYLTAFQAKAAIWIVETPKQEHINAIAWLNEKEMGCDFYLIKIEAIKIAESNPAPLLTVVTGPSAESKIIGKIKKEHTEKENLRKLYWDNLKSLCTDDSLANFNNLSASGTDPFIGISSGFNGLNYVFWVNQKSIRIELRIDRGKDSEEENLSILTKLSAFKERINKVFDSDLNWAELEGYRVCSIRKDYNTFGYLSPQKEWNKQLLTIVSDMKKLIDSTKPILNELNL